jgi:hypothetical protein
VVAVDKINDGFGWKPPAWAVGLESVAILMPLMAGKVFAKKTWVNFPLLAVGVPLLVEGTQRLSDFVEKKLDENDAGVSHWVPKTVISLASTVVGLLAFRSILKNSNYQRATGQDPAQGSGTVIGAEVAVCSRCGGQHLVCASEIGEMLGGIGAWLKGEANNQPKPAKSALSFDGNSVNVNAPNFPAQYGGGWQR